MNTKKIASKSVLLLASLTLAGCITSTQMQPVATEPDVVSTRLAQAAEKAAAALDTISGIEQARAPAMPAPDNFANAPASLNQPITVKWSGPAEQMVETLAGRAGLRFQSKGNRPGVPLTISINVYQKPMIEVLRDIGLQIGRRADITVNGMNNVIEIRYASVDRT
jgi:defect-in-organelle-trafficking protein DotD